MREEASNLTLSLSLGFVVGVSFFTNRRKRGRKELETGGRFEPTQRMGGSKCQPEAERGVNG